MAFSPTLHDKNGQRKYLTVEESHRFYQSLGSLSSKQQAFCKMLYHTGCRLSEALAIKRSDIDIANKWVTIQSLKKVKPCTRNIPLSELYLEELCLLFHLSTNKDTNEERLWSWSRGSGWKAVKAGMRNANITGLQATAKGIRHGFGVRCVYHNVPLHYIQKWMGHSSIVTILPYLIGSGMMNTILHRPCGSKVPNSA